MAAPASVTLVTGEEEFLVDRTIRDLAAQAREALGAGDDGGDTHDLEAGALGPGELATLTSPSLFGGGNVVIVRAAQNASREAAADLARYAAAPSPDAFVIVAHAGGAKGKALVGDLKKAGARIIERPKVTRPSDRADFVKGEFKRAGRQADSGAVQALLDAVGGDLRELASAVDQLASDTDGRITAPVVARYYRGRAEATGFSVADHAVAGRLPEALEQLRWALATGTAPVLITSALASGVRLLGRVGGAEGGGRGGRGGRGGLKSAAALAQEVGAPPWKIDQVRRQLRGWRPEGVAAALQAVAEADAQVKGDSVSVGYALERAIRRIVAARSAGR
ncbi:MAG: DNA polymerase III subunit delta [Nocardiopsaceae bacterium]|nr:DNA polymerase III subunit delta [Nocardiopsaceae bacterium]